MNPRVVRFAILFLVLPLAAGPLAAQDWAGRGRCHGLVKDEAGKPVPGAQIRLHIQGSPEAGPPPFATDKKGRFSYLGLKGGNWTVLIDAQGFLPSQGEYYVNEFAATPPAEITLARNPAASITTGDEALEKGDYKTAREEYLKALEGLDETGQARLRSRIGDTYLNEGQTAQARAEYEKALPYLTPEEQSHVRLQLGNALQAEGNYAAARGEFEQALPQLSGDGRSQVLMTIAQGYYVEGQKEAAIETLAKGLEENPGHLQMTQVIADLLTREGREAEAEKYLAQLPADAELPTDMVLNIGIRLYNEGNAEKALGYFDRAVRESPELSEPYYYRGLSNLSLGRNDAARADFEKLLEIDPQNAHADEVKEFLKFLAQG